ncbi:MAG: tyrosine-type recombinase/integrase [Candidatus Nitrosocosmicus sp.]
MFRAKVFQPPYTNRSYRIFIEGLKSAVTKAAYTYALDKYMKFLGIQNSGELLVHEDNPRIIQDQIIEYLIQLKNPPHSLRYATRSQYVAAIITFYDLNEVMLNKKKIYRYLGEEERPIENRGYNNEEIGKMLEVSDEKVRAILLLLASTGMRIRALVDLKLQDLQEIPKFELYRVTVYSDSNERYFTFATPEATKAIKIYLGYRERYGEKLTSKSPVFRDQFDRNDPASVHDVKHMKLRTIERLISRSIEKSGIRTVERITEFHSEKGKIRKNVRLTAGFRKFFDTQLIYAKVEPRTKELFMGHNIGLDEHYFKPEEDYVLQEYLKAVNNLTINEENRLRKEVADLIRKNNVLENIEIKHNEEIQKIRADMEYRFQQIVAKIDIAKVDQYK